MKIISEYIVLIDRDRNVNFILDSDETFKCHGVSLFNISVSRLYGDSNYLIKNEECINYLRHLITDQQSEIIDDYIVYDFMWQHEIYVEFLSDSVLIEKWGLCTKITLEEFLGIFEELQLFLKRWCDKNEFVDQIKDTLKNKNVEEARRLFCIKGKSKNNGDQIQIVLREDDMEMDVDEYLKSIRYPKQMV